MSYGLSRISEFFYPIQKLNENNEHLKVIEEFKNSMKILPDGRYELYLPFKSDVIELPSNKELTWKRHKKMCERAQRHGLLDDYKAVFKEWEELKIIEKIDCENETSHFLPHQPVVKTNSIATKIRPVFDASAHETGKNSVNDLLYKRPMWLVESPDNWPVTELMNCETSEISSERKKVRLCNLNLSEEKVPVKVQLTELSANSPNPETPMKFPILETSMKSPIPNPSKANQPQVSRCGRAIMRPKRLNLVTLSNVFE
ncbi:hypothetical protein AVEN_157807-1 [Araneus ventricosus]|uniref:Uncharacterized protein n=1 Tax=Araneus ventricosus TaxID=182803 RepID=A0A4Y2IMA9_ARAVE|nr:hypothetical protein AVEN_157807-1 [Araneus ventricosus]